MDQRVQNMAEFIELQVDHMALRLHNLGEQMQIMFSWALLKNHDERREFRRMLHKKRYDATAFEQSKILSKERIMSKHRLFQTVGSI